MPRIDNLETFTSQVFENNDYRIEYSTPKSNSTGFSYTVFDKKDNTTSKLEINVKEETYNTDGECKLVFVKENSEPITLYALRPCTARIKGDEEYKYTALDAKKYMNEPQIGGHRKKDANKYQYTKEIDDVMSIYRALKKGDFDINIDDFLLNRHSKKGDNKIYSKEEASEKILNFMDSYIFNTSGAKEVLAEYMKEHHFRLDEKAQRESINTNKLATIRKKLAHKIDKTLGTNIEEKKIARVFVNFGNTVNKFFGGRNLNK